MNITITKNVKNISVTQSARTVVVNSNRGLRGRGGLSAFEVWLAQGNVGSEEDFFLATGSLTEINDDSVSENTTYSSDKIEDRIDEEVGAEDLDFVLLFQNELSK